MNQAQHGTDVCLIKDQTYCQVEIVCDASDMLNIDFSSRENHVACIVGKDSANFQVPSFAIVNDVVRECVTFDCF